MIANKKDTLTKLFLMYTAISAAAFTIGILLRYLIPALSSIRTLSDETLKAAFIYNSASSLKEKLISLFPVFCTEMKYLVFIFVSGFTNFAQIPFILLCVFRGLLSGYTMASLMTLVKQGELTLPLPFISCTLLLLLSITSIALMAYFCARSLNFSFFDLRPFGLKPLIKRKATYIFLSDFLTTSGIFFIILFIRTLFKFS